MKLFSYLLVLISLISLVACGGDKKPAVSAEPAEADTVFHPQKQDPKPVSHIFSGDLSKYYHISMCTFTPLSLMELEEMKIQPKEDHHYYTVTVGIEKNATPFEFPVNAMQCIYKVWLVPTKFPAGKFNVHAQIMDSNNTSVAQLDFAEAVELKDLLKKCVNQGDFMIIEDLLEIERMFDQPSNVMDIRGYINPGTK